MTILWNCKTNFSIGDSILTADDLVAFAAAQDGCTGIAIADTMSVSAIIDATNAAKKKGLEVIVGAELLVGLDPDNAKFVNVVVYAENEAGFVGIMHALSDTQTVKVGKGQVRFVPKEALLTLLAAGNVSEVSADTGGIYSAALSDAALAAYDAELAARAPMLRRFAALVAAPGVMFARQNANATNQPWPKLLSMGARYLKPEHAEARDLLQAVSKNQRMSDRWRNHSPVGRHLKTAVQADDALAESFLTACKLGCGADSFPIIELAGADDVLRAIAAYRWAKMPVCLPQMAPDEFRALAALCVAGWKGRLEAPVLGYQPDASLLPAYKERLKYELGVLKQLDFSGYFLLVADIVSWAKSQGILVGPGRGSVGGSLIAYIIGITDVDPLRFSLIFERFINPERIDLPDADLDFQSDRRHEVIHYIRNKWGDECVASISNYNTLGAPSALRETGRAYELPEMDYRCTTFIPKEHGQSLTLEEALAAMPEVQAFMEKHPKAWDHALIIEGQMRAMGTHAAGVVIANQPLKNRAVVENRGEDRAVNWDKRTVEDMGLVKIDVLGLANLDILSAAIAKVKEQRGRTIDLLQIPLDDKPTLEAFGLGDTVGVFQFESGGMRKLLKDLACGGPLTFEELSAATALFRPGPLDSGLLDDYVNIRKGVASEYYEHPNLEAALKETRGVIVYQEQVMQICRDLSGFTMPESDGVRKAIGKKDKDKMASFGEKFVDGAVSKSGMDRDLAQVLWDRIELFGGYGFNKSHSVEYAIISVWTMWFKIHYPHAFYAACLEVMKEDRLQAVTQDALKRGIRVLPPDINQSGKTFLAVGDDLLIPLGRIKGLGEIAQNAVIAARDRVGAFTSKEHLLKEVERRKCNVRHVEILDAVGALASVTPGALPAAHPDRTRAQLELLPGLVCATVRADRGIVVDGFVRNELAKVIIGQRAEINAVTQPRLGKKPRFMVIFDSPNYKDEQAGKLMEHGGPDEPVKLAMRKAGLTMNDGYFTCLSKTIKQNGALSKDQINQSKPFLERELELLKPPIIICLGSASFRSFLPDLKGSVMDLSGTVHFLKGLDASVVVGISPGMLFHDPSKQVLLDEAFLKVAELLL